MATSDLNLAFTSKVSKLPVVNSAWLYATGTYSHFKNYSDFLNYTLTTAEKSVFLAAEQAKPILLKFKDGVHMVDELACEHLDKLQQKIPIIADCPEEILEKTRQLYHSAIKSGMDKCEGLKNYGTEKAKIVQEFSSQKATELIGYPYGRFISSTLNDALVTAENSLNYYLPPLDAEGDCDRKLDVNEQLAARARSLSCKVRRRMSHNVSKQICKLQDSMANMGIVQWKDNLNMAAQNTVMGVWERMPKAEFPTRDDVCNHAIFAARIFTTIAANTTNEMIAFSNYLSQTAATGLEATNKYAEAFYTQLAEANVVQKSAALLTQFSETAVIWENGIYNAMGSIWKLYGLRRL